MRDANFIFKKRKFCPFKLLNKSFILVMALGGVSQAGDFIILKKS